MKPKSPEEDTVVITCTQHTEYVTRVIKRSSSVQEYSCPECARRRGDLPSRG